MDYRRDVETRTGIMPSPKKFLQMLQRGVTLGVLEYRAHNDNTRAPAGFYPVEKPDDDLDFPV